MIRSIYPENRQHSPPLDPMMPIFIPEVQRLSVRIARVGMHLHQGSIPLILPRKMNGVDTLSLWSSEARTVINQGTTFVRVAYVVCMYHL